MFIQQEGEGYLDLEQGEDDAFEQRYLQPDFVVPLTPGSPTSLDKQCNIPLPTIPDEDIEMETLKNTSEEEKKKFVLCEPPKGKRAQRMDSELEKVQRDAEEKEKLKSSDSSSPGNSVSEDGELTGISEKEQLKSEDDEEKDVCERNSGVFDSPPPYESRTDEIMYCAENPLQGDMEIKTVGGYRGRQPSNRYVNS